MENNAAMELSALRAFVKVAELSSFTRAAEQLGSSKSRVSATLRALEDELGTRLLLRTTRAVRLTPDGEQLLTRAGALLADADDVSSMFGAARSLRGRVRLGLPSIFARDVVIPRIPELLAAHPNLELFVSTTDRHVNVVREGFDCVLRIGALGDSGLVARRLGALPMVNCASPAYLRKYGTPRTLADLEGHYVVHYSQRLSGEPPSFEHREGGRVSELPMKALVTVNGADAYLAACLAGLGIIQVPLSGKSVLLDQGALVEILPEHGAAPMPVSIVRGEGRSVPRRVRVVMTFLEETLARYVT